MKYPIASFVIILLLCWAAASYLTARWRRGKKQRLEQARELERQVEVRTADLKATNRRLQLEIDRRSATEAALRKSEASNQAMLHAIPDRIYRIDRDGVFLDFRVNMADQSVSILDDIMAETVADLKPEIFARQMKAHLLRVLETGEIQSFEYEADRRHHEARIVREGADTVVAIVRDVTGRKQMERHIVHLERQRALGELSHGVSHNFNNILTGILGPAQLIQRKAKDQGILQAADMIIDSARRASDLVKRLSRAMHMDEKGKLYPVDVNKVITEAVEALHPLWRSVAKKAGVSVELVTELGEAPPVRATREGLQTLINNLLTNAVDALPKGGTITLGTRAVEGGVELTVHDNGVGMEEAVSRRVFEPFFTTKKEVGPGLGLAIVNGIVTGWNGEVAVQSAPGKGSTFRVTLLACQDADIACREERDLSSKRILIVDNESTVRYTLAKFLEAHHDVETVADGRAALAGFTKGRYDVAFIDLIMPEMNGDAVASSIKKIDPDVSTILITGAPIKEDDPRLSAFDAYLRKPFADLEEVYEAMDRVGRPTE